MATKGEIDSTGSKYDAGQIQVLKGLEAVRKRPGMYIGSTSERGLHHLVYEVVDNSIDEALVGYADDIRVTIHPDNSITVDDNGRGIPVDIHPTEKMPGVELAMTVLHAGGKFDKNTYKVSGGLHGVGVSVVNALSENLKVWVKRDGKEYFMDFARGKTLTKLKTLRDVPKSETGTKVWFKPDPQIFTDLVYRYDTLAMRLRELSFLNKGVMITLTDERAGQEKAETFHAKGGLKEFVQHLNATRKALHPEVMYIETTRDDVGVELAMQYNDGYNENVFSFVNNINTHEGGTHLTGFKSALTRVINDYASKGNFLKKADFTLSGDDVREGLTAVLSVKVREPQFEGQTKTKLGNSEVESAVKTLVNEWLAAYLDEHPRTSQHRRRKGGVGGARARSGAQGARSHAPQVGARRRQSARQARRLFAHRSGDVRALSRRRRLGRRLGQAGAQARVPGDPAAPRQDHQRREGAHRQGAVERRNPHDHHRDRQRHQGRVRARQDALPQDHHHDGRRRRRRAHPHAAADVLLPPDARAHRSGLRLHRAAAALPRGEGAAKSTTPTTSRSAWRSRRGSATATARQA